MKFIFRAKNREGEIREGTIEAANSDAALNIVQKNGLFPLSIIEEKATDSISKTFLKYYEKVTAKELVIFFRQLAILIEARVPILISLTAINEQTNNKYFNRVISEMVRNVEDGMPFSNAMEKHRDVFSNLTVSIIRAGETSGNLKKAVEYVADNIERNYNLSSRIRSALIYPAVIMVVFFIIGFLAVTFILPKLSTMIRDLKADVPWYTAMVMWVGDFMSSYWWAVLLIIFGIIAGFYYYLRSDDGSKEFDQIKIKIPIIGKIFQNVYITRFTENLAVLLGGGIPIIRALTVVSSVIGNSVYQDIILKTAEEVKNGGNMSTVLGRYPLIPPMVTHMVKIGEDSGQLESVLNHIATFYENETETMTKNLSTLIEPVLMIVIGFGVGFMAFSILMPIYNIAGQL